MSPTATPPTPRAGQGAPPMLALALPFAGLTIVGLVLGINGPRPDAGAGEVATYLAQHSATATLLATVVFFSAIPLGLYAVVAHHQLRRHGVTAVAPMIALTGGLLAAAALMTSGLTAWTAATTADLGETGVLRALRTMSFATGGPGFAVPLALLVAGVAVPSLLLGLLPKALAWTGLVVAAGGMLSGLSLLTSTLYPLIPVGRFGGLIFLVAAAVLLPRARTASPA